MAHWDAIENAGRGIHDGTAERWVDLSGHGFDWSVSLSGASWSATGLAFNGTATVCTMADTALQNANAFNGKMTTVEFVYSNAEGRDGIIFCPGYGATAYLYTDKNGHVGFWGPSSTGSRFGVSAETDQTVCYSVTYVRDEGDATKPTGIQSAYVNGVQATSDGMADYWSDAMNKPYLGGRGKSPFCKGTLSAIRIYDHELSDSERARNLQVDVYRFCNGAKPSVKMFSVSKISSQVSDLSEPVEPDVEVTDAETGVVVSPDLYTVEFANNASYGTATVKIRGKVDGAYADCYAATTFRIVSSEINLQSNTKNVMTISPKGGQITTGKVIVNAKGSFTLAGWVKLDKANMTAAECIFIGQMADKQPVFMLGYDATKDEVFFARRATGWGFTEEHKTRAAAPPDGEWHFYAGVWDEENLKRNLYIDGTLVASGDGTGSAAPVANLNMAGSAKASNFIGSLAEMSVWTGALDAAKIAAIMTTRPIGDTLENCLGYWPLDEGNGGTSVTDLAGGNAGTVSAANCMALKSTDDFPDFRVVSPRFAVTAELAYDRASGTIAVTAVPTEPPAGTDLSVILTDGEGVESMPVTFATDVVDGSAYATTLTGIEPNKSYKVTVIAEDAFHDVTRADAFAYSGEISIAPETASVTGYGEDGVFVVSRGDSADATAYDLVVSYTIDGTAVNGTDYHEISDCVTILSGESSARVFIKQVADTSFDEDRTIVLTLAGVRYLISSTAGAATVTKKFYSENHEKKVLSVKADLGTSISANAPVLLGNGSFTVAVWAKLDKENMPLSDSRYPCGPMMSQNYHFCYERGKDNLMFEHGGTTRAAAPYSGEWHFLSAVFDKDAKQRRIYIDGILKAEEADTSTGSQSANFAFGYLAWGNFFRGSLTEMSAWNKAMTAEEIKAIMWTRPDDFTDCAGYWPLDEGDAGATARDISGNGKTLALGDATKHALETATDFVDFTVGDTRIKYDAVIQYPKDLVTVEISGTEMVGGKFIAGSQGTFAASCPGHKFIGWFGDVEESQSHNETITLTMDTTKVLVPIYEFDWVYDPAAKTISDGYWVLNVTEKNAELTLTGIAATTVRNTSGQPAAPLLDLRKGLTESYSIVTIAAKAFIQTTSLKIVRLPDTLRRMEGNWGNASGAVGPFWSCTNLETVEPFLPQGLELLGSYTFQGCSKLGGDLVLGADEGEFAFNLGAYHRHYFNGTAITSATLRKNVSMIPFNTFESCSKLETVVCEGVITNIEGNAFSNCKAVKEFTLRERPETIAATAFNGWTAYQSMFKIDPSDEGWEAYMADPANFTAWVDLSSADKAKFRTAFPGVRKPLGLSLAVPAKQWLWSVKEPGLAILVR